MAWARVEMKPLPMSIATLIMLMSRPIMMRKRLFPQAWLLVSLPDAAGVVMTVWVGVALGW